MVTLKKLDNGIRIVMDPMPELRSVTIGFWVNCGTVRENKKEAGASHFIEHMLFKGTEKRTALDISSEIDNIGGLLNAFTSREYTCYYAKVLDEHLPVAIDILSDIVFHASFPKDELEKERKVVIEEILMNEDSPEDVSSEAVNALFFEGDALMNPILGTQESILSMSRETLVSYKENNYIPENIVISCAGSFCEDKLLNCLDKIFDREFHGEIQKPFSESFKGGYRIKMIEKDIEQCHISISLPGYAKNTREYLALNVLSNVFGGNMSSRIFQKIREEKGLAYSVYSYPVGNVDTGSFQLYAGTGEKQVTEVIQILLEELIKLKDSGITEAELNRGKEQFKGNYVLGMESSNSHMIAIGRKALLDGTAYNETELLEQISAINMKDIDAIIPYVTDVGNLCAAVVGRTEKSKDEIKSIFDSFQKR